MSSRLKAYYTDGASRTQMPDKVFSSTSSSTNLNLARRDLMTPDEVMRLPEGNLILLRPGAHAALARKVRYYADPEFSGLF